MQDRETAHRLPLEFALSQLRHGYQQLHEHRVSRRGMREFAAGIIAPAIRRLEQALASPLSAPPQEPTPEQKRMVIDRIDAKKAKVGGEMQDRETALRNALRELTAMVRGECPSLLNEDSGGNGELSCEIDALLASAPPQEPTGASPVEPTPEPETCTSECNPYMSRCGAKFCTFEDMAAHEQECKRLVPSEETPR